MSAAQNFVSGLRSFLRFCFIEGLVGSDLSRAALFARGRPSSSLPRGISRADARALLGSCDRRQALGRRDHAMIIMLLRLGFRRSEVAGLRLDDIDWRAGVLAVRGKGARQDRLPLPSGRGRRDRVVPAPRPAAQQPAGGVPAGQSPVRADRFGDRGLDRAPGVQARRDRGVRVAPAAPHGGCEMVQAKVPIDRIGQVLRHQSLQTTAIYARLDIERLRLLAAPWPGGAGR